MVNFGSFGNTARKKNSIKKNSIMVIMSCVIMFLFLSLISFSSQDNSFLHRSLPTSNYNNWFGLCGAYSASFLILLYGGVGSFLLIAFFIFCLACWYQKKPVMNNYDQYIAWVFFIVSGSTALYSMKFDFLLSGLSGGLIGKNCASILYHLFDPLLCTLFVATIFFSSFCIITRLFFITTGIALLQFLMSNRVIAQSGAQVYVIVKKTLALCISPLAWCFKKLGIFFDDSSLNKTAQKLVIEDLESEDDEANENDQEKFWQTYLVHEVQKLHSTDLKVHHEANKKEIAFTGSSVDQAVEPVENLKKKTRKLYQIPLVSWFRTDTENDQEIKDNHKLLATILEEKLERFGIKGRVTSIKVGPVITLFEYQPEIDSKISKIIALEDDLALALQALSIRIIAPIPGRSVVGFEVSNKQRRTVLLGQVLQSPEFKNSEGHLPLVLGQDSIGSTVIVDLATMPHLLVAGSTGSGKSVALNAMLVSLLCKHSPETLKLILIDPKRLEFASYADIPHLLVPIITDPRKAALVLKWVVKTMEKRYALMEEANVRNIFDYHTLLKQESDRPPMPFIVVMIDELSDLMMTAPKETEDLIARITQMARAAGIHMVVATQRPSIDVITGLIKVNFPSRISFRVTSKIDSRTILDCNGADKLLGKGDMLFLDSSSALKRAHGAYVSDKEIEKLVSHIRSQQQVVYIDPAQDFVSQVHDEEVDDQLYHEVLRFVQSIDEVSISLLQRKFRIGYNRSARIIDKLESQGIIMQEPGGKTRKVIR